MILEENRTPTARILAELGRQQSDETSVGKRGIGNTGILARAMAIALGGARPGGNRPLPRVSEVTDWLNQVNLPHRVVNRGDFGSQYVEIPSPILPNRPDTVTRVRFPSDEHIGRPERLRDTPNRFDTGTNPVDWRNLGGPSGARYPANVNTSGGAYSEIQNLLDALRWRFSRDPSGQWLIPPGQEPIHRTIPHVDPGPAPRSDPNQLQLLSGAGAAGLGALSTQDIVRILQNGSQQ